MLFNAITKEKTNREYFLELIRLFYTNVNLVDNISKAIKGELEIEEILQLIDDVIKDICAENKLTIPEIEETGKKLRIKD